MPFQTANYYYFFISAGQTFGLGPGITLSIINSALSMNKVVLNVKLRQAFFSRLPLIGVAKQFLQNTFLHCYILFSFFFSSQA